jgi:predicted ATP-binding protein involved in virulence
MKIQKISINGLFGIFDHEISLNLKERITIIHGPNGVGKTVILRMLSGFLNSQYSIFRKIPFKTFKIDFTNGCNVTIKVGTRDNIRNENQKIDITYSESGSRILQRFSLSAEQQLSERQKANLRFHPGIWDEIIPEIRRIGIREWQYLPTGSVMSEHEVLEQYQDILVNEEYSYAEDPGWLINLKDDVHIRLIEEQRLLHFPSSHSSRKNSKPSWISPKVLAYSEEIAQLIQSKLAEYAVTSQSLDRTFPSRVVQKLLSPEVTEKQLRRQLKQLGETRSRLIKIGLLEQDEDTDFLTQVQSVSDSTRNVLSVYIEDVEKKLAVFRELASKIDLLKRIINKKFAYSYKEISFSKEKGFTFNTLYHPNSPTHGTVSPSDLSSGEQHELVLLYELLFKVQPNSLVLIDEPELSLHVGWQSQFLKDLQEITELADLDILIATHSPDIIQDRWDLTVELKRPQQ